MPDIETRTALLARLRVGVHSRVVGAAYAAEALVQAVHVRLHTGADVDRIRRLRRHGCQVGAHDIVDVNEVASLEAVAGDGHRLIPQESLREYCDDAGSPVRVLTGTVDVGVTQRDEFEPAHP